MPYSQEENPALTKFSIVETGCSLLQVTCPRIWMFLMMHKSFSKYRRPGGVVTRPNITLLEMHQSRS